MYLFKKKKRLHLKTVLMHMHRGAEISIFLSLTLAISQPRYIYFNKTIYTEDSNISEGIFDKRATRSNCQNKR